MGVYHRRKPRRYGGLRVGSLDQNVWSDHVPFPDSYSSGKTTYLYTDDTRVRGVGRRVREKSREWVN